jgi:hypothetical protein
VFEAPAVGALKLITRQLLPSFAFDFNSRPCSRELMTKFKKILGSGGSLAENGAMSFQAGAYTRLPFGLAQALSLGWGVPSGVV